MEEYMILRILSKILVALPKEKVANFILDVFRKLSEKTTNTIDDAAIEIVQEVLDTHFLND